MAVPWTASDGLALRGAREAQGWSQAEVALKVGRTASRISELERAVKGPPSGYLLDRIRAVLPAVKQRLPVVQPSRAGRKAGKRESTGAKGARGEEKNVADAAACPGCGKSLNSAKWLAYDRLIERVSSTPPFGVKVVDRSLPIPFFGNPMTAGVATISNNPSPHEYDPAKDRLARTDKGELRADFASRNAGYALARMEHYYHWDPYRVWFTRPSSLLGGMGLSYERGEAIHLDLVNEPTVLTTGKLKLEGVWDNLVEAERPMLMWTIATFDIRILLIDGAVVAEQMDPIIRAPIIEEGDCGRRHWRVGITAMDSQELAFGYWDTEFNDRSVGCSLADASALGRDVLIALRKVRVQLEDHLG